MRGNRAMFPGKSIYNRETISTQEQRISEYRIVILNKGQTKIWEEVEIYSQEKVYTIERILVDKNIGLVNTE